MQERYTKKNLMDFHAHCSKETHSADDLVQNFETGFHRLPAAQGAVRAAWIQLY